MLIYQLSYFLSSIFGFKKAFSIYNTLKNFRILSIFRDLEKREMLVYVNNNLGKIRVLLLCPKKKIRN